MFSGRIRDEDDACFAPFSDDAELSADEVDVLAVEVTDLTDTQTRGVQEVKEGKIAQSIALRDVDGFEHRGELLAREHFHLSTRHFRQFDLLRRDRFDIVLLKMLEHRSKGDEMVLLSLDIKCGPVAFDRCAVEVESVALYDVFRELAYIGFGACKCLKSLEVVMVIFHGFLALVLADLTVREEVVDGRVEEHGGSIAVKMFGGNLSLERTREASRF